MMTIAQKEEASAVIEAISADLPWRTSANREGSHDALTEIERAYLAEIYKEQRLAIEDIWDRADMACATVHREIASALADELMGPRHLTSKPETAHPYM